jgi:hypothetical protein
MSFYKIQEKNSVEYYRQYLQLVGSISQLFSTSLKPFLHYRAAEKVFCKAFSAKDLGRSDLSVDAKKDDIGIGLKTFLIGNSRTFQKVAEFNQARALYENKPLEDKIKSISALRNERIKVTKNIFSIKQCIYHCVVRTDNLFHIFEEPLSEINIENIQDILDTRGSICFNDGENEYSFLKSKSTLTKRFITAENTFVDRIPINILDDPLEALKVLIDTHFKTVDTKIYDTIFLPLYGRNKTVYERSGLNQWNARGRERDINEVYIPIPSIIHRLFPDFFPNREQPFNLKLPDGRILPSKICQAGGKALMSHSNKALGQWILRDVLQLKEGEILTYKKLQEIGIDAVRIDKIGNLEYEINFSEIGSFETFLEDNQQ